MAAPIEIGTKAKPHYSSKPLKHLGLVAGRCDELGIVELIAQWIPQHEEKQRVSIEPAVQAMILNGLGFANRALYRSPLFLSDKPVKRLIGEGIEADHLNDDRLGRVLDTIYEYNPNLLYSQLATAVVNSWGLGCPFGHLDSTGFHTDGEYNSNQVPQEGVVPLTKGYSHDHRPDLNQVVLQLICERPAGIPLLMQTLNGNHRDQESFRDMVENFTEPRRVDFGVEYRIADSALYTANNLSSMNTLLWISRVPETLNLAGDLIDVVAPGLRSDLTQKSCRRFEVEYGGVQQRWVIIFSPQAYQRAQPTVNQPCHKQSTTESKALAKRCQQDFACEAEAR
jgi:transposase